MLAFDKYSLQTAAKNGWYRVNFLIFAPRRVMRLSRDFCFVAVLETTAKERFFTAFVRTVREERQRILRSAPPDVSSSSEAKDPVGKYAF